MKVVRCNKIVPIYSDYLGANSSAVHKNTIRRNVESVKGTI